MLSIPNPAFHVKLCSEVGGAWTDLFTRIRRSPLSLSAPVLSGTGERAVVPRHMLGDLSLERVKSRRNARYVLIADIAEYYRSVYTHSIPWALHGKEYAKQARRDLSLLGNRIDVAVRNSQDQQTNGIPTGPDTSLIIGELILSAIDVGLMDVINPLRGFRYYDDYELMFSQYSDAERALRTLQAALSEYNLMLNPLKTRIQELPQTIEVPWVLEFRDFDFKIGKPNSKQRIIRFFDKAFEYRERHKDSYILAYAVGRAEREQWTPTEWDVVQDLLFQVVTVEPSATRDFVIALTKARVAGRNIDLEAMAGVLNDIVKMNAEPGNGSEAAWGLWGLLAFGQSLDTAATASVSKCSDTIVALLALDARSKGLVAANFDDSRWAALMTQEDLYRAHWLLTYEALLKGWLPPTESKDYIADDPFFSRMRVAGISFYSPVDQPSQATIRRLETRKARSYAEDSSDDDSAESLEDLEDDGVEEDEDDAYDDGDDF
jgi:hypothetical protein